MPALQQRADEHEAMTIGDEDAPGELTAAPAKTASSEQPDSFITSGFRGYLLYQSDPCGHRYEEGKFEHGGIGGYD